MLMKIFTFLFLLLLSNCENNLQLVVPDNQPIRDLVDNEQTSSSTNTVRQPSSVSSTNSSGAVGGPMSGAVGTPPASPAAGTATGDYAGYPTTSGY